MATINESIEKLQSYVKQIDEKASSLVDKVSPENKVQIETIANKTKETIVKSINKLEELKGSINDETLVQDFLGRLDTRCKEISDYTIEKLDTFKPVLEESLNKFMESLNKTEELKEEPSKKTSDIEFKLTDTYNRLVNNPNVVNATNMVKNGVEKVVEFYNSDETQEFINTMKIKTINIAEKGLEELKILLDRQDNKDGE